MASELHGRSGGDDIEQIVLDWCDFLRSEKLYGLDDPLFPSTNRTVNSNGKFEASGLSRRPWSTTGPIRAVLREAFEAAELPAPNPHSFRTTLVALGREVCTTWAEMQAWAQNLGHESLTTTFGSYGKVGAHEQGALIRNARKTKATVTGLADRLARLEARDASAMN